MLQDTPNLPVEPDDEIEACLSKPWYALSFSKRLERRYRKYISSTHRSQLRFALLLLIAAHLVLLMVRDMALAPSLRSRGVLIETGIVLPLALWGYLYLRRERTVLQQCVATLVPSAVAGVNDLWIAAHLNAQLADRHLMGLAMGIFINNAIMPLPLPAMTSITVFLLALYDAVLAGSLGPVAAPQSAQMAVMMSFFVLVSLGIRWRYEADDKHTFLLAARDRIHTQMLAWANRQLTELSYTDALTGMPNRRFFNETMARAWEAAQKSGNAVGALMIDVDHFKRYNDSMGHAAGDQCLRRVAQAIQFNVRVERDTVARYGGEEFVAILPKATLEDSIRVAERIRMAVEDLQIRHSHDSAATLLTVSIGAACCEDTSEFNSPAVLLHAADLALYSAKKEGRNRVSHRQVAPAEEMPDKFLS